MSQLRAICKNPTGNNFFAHVVKIYIYTPNVDLTRVVMHGKHLPNDPVALYGCLFIHIRMCAWVLVIRKCLYFNILFLPGW